MAVELGSEHPCCNHTRQFLYLHWCPNNGQVRQALLRRADFEDFCSTGTCLGCANRKSWSKTSVDHSEQCRFRMKAVSVTTTEGNMRLSEPGSALLSLPRHQVWWSLRTRDSALRAKGGSLLRHQHQQRWSRVSEVTTSKVPLEKRRFFLKMLTSTSQSHQFQHNCVT